MCKTGKRDEIKSHYDQEVAFDAASTYGKK